MDFQIVTKKRPEIEGQIAMHQRFEAPVEMARRETATLVDLGDLLRSVWADFWILGSAIALCVVVGLFKIQTTTPTFWAESRIMLGTNEVRLSAGASAAPQMEVSDATVANEIAVLKSNLLIGELVDDLELEKFSEYSQRRASSWSLSATLARIRYQLGGDSVEIPEAAYRSREQIIDQVQSNLAIRSIGISHGIRIGFMSESKELAAAVPNTLVQIYFDRRYTDSLAETKRASKLLSVQAATWRDTVSQLEAEIVERRGDFVKLDQSDRESTKQLLLDISTELNQVRNERIAISAKLDSLLELRDAQGRQRVAALAQSVTLDRMIEARTDALILQRELSASLGPENAESKAAVSELRAIDNLLAQGVDAYLEALSDELEVKVSHEKALGMRLRNVTNSSVALEQASIELDQLDREAAAAREVYETLLKRQNEVGAEEAFGRAGARIIERADIPLAHAAPKKSLLLAGSLIGGLFLGLTVIIIRQLLGGRVRSVREIERLVELPVLAALPRVGVNRDRLEKRNDLIFGPRQDEDFRKIRNFLVSNQGQSGVPLTCIFTSQAAGDGKTSACVQTARKCARSNLKVLVIDADLRSGGLSKKHTPTEALGLSEAILAQTMLDGLFIRPFYLNFDILPAGQAREEAIDRVDSETVKTLLLQLQTQYDVILIDASHVTGASEIPIWLQHVGQTVVVFDAHSTSRRAMTNTINDLVSMKAKISGIVANKATFQTASSR